jgi:outer membrane protein assembly factor BamE (lipoprotein component of BamABCDE complex)
MIVMTFVYRKHYKKLYIILFLFLLNNCQLKEPDKQHGINFLENREKTLKIGKTNQNDVIKLLGTPHSKSLTEDKTWIYFERTITRGKMIKLGQNVLKENNILELKFNKYGILDNKKIYNKKNMNVVKYSNKETENDISQQSFVGKFLSSVKQKMYGKKKF